MEQVDADEQWRVGVGSSDFQQAMLMSCMLLLTVDTPPFVGTCLEILYEMHPHGIAGLKSFQLLFSAGHNKSCKQRVERDVRAQSQQLFECCLQRRPFGEGAHAADGVCRWVTPYRTLKEERKG
jgi:hypothetical protein